MANEVRTRADTVNALKKYSTLILLALMLLINVIFTPNFFKLGTVWNIVIQTCSIILTGMGMTLVISTGGIDISVGSVMALSGIITGMLLERIGILPAALLGVLACTVSGAIAGFMIGKLKVQAIYNWFGSKSTIAALLLLLIFSGIAFAGKNFLAFDSLMNVARKAASDGGFLALGMTFVILIGQIDLSVGSVMAMAGVIAGLLQSASSGVALLGGLCVGAVCGFMNGLMVAKLRVASWIATLAMMLAMRGAVLLVTNQKPVSISSKFFQQMGNMKLAGVPLLVILLVLMTLLCMHISRNTRYGMALYAVGGNEEAARMMGLKVDRVKITAYVCCGLFAALAGILLAGRMYTAQPNAGKGWETTAIAMCALGGVKLSGGEGKFSGAFFGALVISVITTIFNYAPNVNTWWQNVVMGLLVLLSVGLQSDVFKSRRVARRAQKQTA